jgi:hypothetical protein
MGLGGTKGRRVHGSNRKLAVRSREAVVKVIVKAIANEAVGLFAAEAV